MKKLILVLVLVALVLSGCSTTQYAKKVVDEICGMEESKRTALKSTVDAAVFPHKIRVECDGQLEK